FGELSELKTPSGLLALIDLPQPHVSPSHSHFCILLEDVQDPGNLGSILRTAAAAGCDAAFLSAGCADVWSPKVLRAAMGGHFAMSVHSMPICSMWLQSLRGIYSPPSCGPRTVFIKPSSQVILLSLSVMKVRA
ncbi:MAG: hypothetical protein K2X64_12390, partial [Rhodocyclaceae bacterium]|nr:hypothetical protein [Rhodocyclaceae bacterium]